VAPIAKGVAHQPSSSSIAQAGATAHSRPSVNPHLPTKLVTTTLPDRGNGSILVCRVVCYASAFVKYPELRNYGDGVDGAPSGIDVP